MGIRKIRWSRKATSSGKIDEKMSTSKNTYYSFLSHPKYRIVYRYTDTDLYIVAIRATQMNNL